MSKINIVTTDELREMRGSEGLILQGCGGDLTEWVDGINEMLTKEGILLEGTKFDEVHAFKHEGLTNLKLLALIAPRKETQIHIEVRQI